MANVAGEWAESKTFKINDTVSVEMTIGPSGFVCEWIPEQPKALTQRELDRYRMCRNKMVARLSEKIGGKVLIVDV